MAVHRDTSDSGRYAPEVSGVFGRLFDEHAGELFGYLARRVDPGLAEDLVADTFEVALRQWQRYNPERGSARSWLYGIATNLLRRHARQEQQTVRAMGRLAGAHDVAERADARAAERVDARVAERVDATARVRQLAAALNQLSVGDRDVLLLTAWAQLDTTEVAAALDIPVGTVRSRLHRVRRWIRVHAPVAQRDG